MIQKNYIKIFEIPCKNKYSNSITIFESVGYDYTDAIQRLSNKLNALEWIIGYGSM